MNHSNMAPAGVNTMRWDLTAEDIVSMTDGLIAETKAVYDAVGALKPEEVTFENSLKVRKS